jgi:FixJ family two-component response regulator
MTQPEVFLVDADASVLRALTCSLESEGFIVRSWQSPYVFLREHDPSVPGCLIVDVATPGLNGFELQRTLAERGCGRFIIFITACGDISTSVQAMKAGAVSYLPKPVHHCALVAAVREALAMDEARREEQLEKERLAIRLGVLTKREREVLNLVVLGKMNKQIASMLGLSQRTVKIHRRHVMDKLQVRSLAELVLLAVHAGLAPASQEHRGAMVHAGVPPMDTTGAGRRLASVISRHSENTPTRQRVLPLRTSTSADVLTGFTRW